MRKVVLVVLIIISVLFLLINRNSTDTTPVKENNVGNLSNKEVIEEVKEILLPGFDVLDVSNPGKLLCNMNENFYLQFRIILTDTEEVIYSSGLVGYDSYINSIELSRDLEKGMYEAMVFIQPYDMAMNKTNSALIRIKLKI